MLLFDRNREGGGHVHIFAPLDLRRPVRRATDGIAVRGSDPKATRPGVAQWRRGRGSLFVALELVVDVGTGGIGMTDLGRARRLGGVDFLCGSSYLAGLRARLGSGSGRAGRRRCRGLNG